ncbi:MAG: 30S ribosomal protein S6 [Nitrospinota bacterium]
MSSYETVIIYHPDLSDEVVETATEGLRERLSAEGAEISDCEHWGKRRLAYAIRRQRYGYYVLFRYSAPPGLIHETERRLQLSEQVLKYFTVRCRPGQTTPPELLKGERARVEEPEAPERKPAQEIAPAKVGTPEEGAAVELEEPEEGPVKVGTPEEGAAVEVEEPEEGPVKVGTPEEGAAEEGEESEKAPEE